jgi:hypothetical protein
VKTLWTLEIHVSGAWYIVKALPRLKDIRQERDWCHSAFTTRIQKWVRPRKEK